MRAVSDSAIFYIFGVLLEEGKDRSIPITDFAVEHDFHSNTFWSQTPYPDLANKARDLALEFLEQIRFTCEQNGIRLVVVSIPSKEQVYARELAGEGYDVRYPQKFVEDYANRHGVPYYDLLPFLRSTVRESGMHPYMKNDPHFNNDGHRVVGKHLAEYFRSQVLSLH
jgi:hypothetical protein